MSVRAKFVVTSVSEPKQATRFLGEGKTEQIEAFDISLIPVTASYDNPENTEFFTNTPSGSININTINPDAASQFERGQEYYVDFTKVEKK